MSLQMKKTHHQKPNKAMMRREDRLKGLCPKTRFMGLRSWQEHQQKLSDQREAQQVYEKVYAEIQKAQGQSDKA